jgi:DUF1365 family protein
MENDTNTDTTINTIDNIFENTHNYCTPKKCLYNPDSRDKKTNIKYHCSANFCISCSVNMGDSNPRQYCMKTYCPYEDK